MAKRHEVELSDAQWEKIAPLLPQRKRSRKGGRPPVDDRACFEGILWVLRSGARWRDLPERFPSPSTCWRRLTEWEADGVLEEIWHAFLDTLDERGLIDWDEVFVDGIFSPAKRGDQVGKTKRGKATKLVVADGPGAKRICRRSIWTVQQFLACRNQGVG